MQKLIRSLVLVFSALLLSAAICLFAVVVLVLFTNYRPAHSVLSAETIADELAFSADGCRLSADGQALLQAKNAWAMLLDSAGDVTWSENKPADLPAHYTVADAAVFSRWYLQDYPVTVWRCGTDLLVVGSPKGYAWKYNLIFRSSDINAMMWFFPILFFSLLAALLLLGRFSSQREQRRRDSARSRWIDGISHDIRTPLSILMGYAGEWTEDSALPEARRQQAAAAVAACRSVKDLVADLNLTMRLDYEMQPLRRESTAPAALLRAAAADALNSGMIENAELQISPACEALRVSVDSVLIRRALTNLLQNAARHGETRDVRLTLSQERGMCLFCVENTCAGSAVVLAADLSGKGKTQEIARDGTAAHGTGLHLVRQIAKAHHGSLRFTAPASNVLRAEFRVAGGKQK